MDEKRPAQSTKDGGGKPPRPASLPSPAPAPVDAPGKTKEVLQAAPKIEVPKGGGAIKGIGEKFQANPATGTAGITVPIAMSPGRNGFQPSLSLSYNSGSGNGPFGLGWSLSIPSVKRKTDKGLPEYHDATDSDVFMLSEAEDLVPCQTDPTGAWPVPTDTWDDGAGTVWAVRRYRPRVEGAFARIERWTHPTTGDVHWRTISKENVTRIYGQSDTARLADPDNAKHVFEWYLEEERDEVGNVTKYVYDGHERDTAVAAIYERNRGSAKNGVAYTYLKRVYYANVTPFSTAGGFYFELVFDYGDHTSSPPTRSPDATTCPARPDVYSSYRSGFDVRCYRLCDRVLLFHRFDTGADADATLVRSTAFTYAESAVASTLTSVTVTGYRSGASESLPALSFTYVGADIDASVQFVDGVDDLPPSLDISRYQWVDLDGEGLTGLLTEQGGTWYYKRNEGGGALGATVALGSRPNVDLMSAGTRLMDVNGDGRLELVRLRDGVAGYHTRSADGGWEGFRSFKQVPSAAWNDAGTRTIDLDGDGFADLLVTENDVFTWYPSTGTDGWAVARRAWRKRDEEKGPQVLFAAGQEAILLADMNGDGLTDLVRVRSGNICYWPNKGYGRFGAKVQMQGAPRFDTPDRFDPKRIRLGDIDGTGPADLVYLGPTKVRFWFNESGNRWGDEQEIPEFPGVEDSATVSLADLLGNGTQCLVWSSPLLRDGWAPLRYIELMASGKPYLLKTIQNGLGRTTTLTYAPSTQFYVDDRQAGTPWATRLSFPVQCLERVEIADAVTGWRFVTTYSYHHGYFDGAEREFRGFGMVEQRDAESVDDYDDTSHGTTPLDLPPVVTKTWFHTGAWKEQGTLEETYATEYFVDGSAFSLDGSSVDTGDASLAAMSASERREAARALKGRMLRQEVYAEDGDVDREALPYVVTASNYTVTRLQAKEGDVHPIFRVDPRETITWHYERDTATSKKPRVQHQLTLAVDDYGNVTRSATVAYAKRGASTTATPPDPEAIAVSVVLVTESDAANDTGATEGAGVTPHWHIGVACAQRTYELSGLTTAIVESSGDRATIAGLNVAIDGNGSTVSPATRIDWDGAPSGTTLRLLSHQLTSYFYCSDAGVLGSETFYTSSTWAFGAKALIYQKYARALTTGFLTNTAALGDLGLSSTVDLPAAGYVTPSTQTGYWVPSGTRALDASHFYVATAYTDPFGESTAITWDSDATATVFHYLFPVEVEDPLGNTVTAEIDYTALQPSKVTDPNGNWTEAVFDALGRVTELRVVGKAGEGDPSGTVTDPTTKFDYHLTATPAYVRTRQRETHAVAMTDADWRDRYTYTDGGGNVVQEKVSAEPDPDTSATRWVGTGRVVLNNKGLPVKKYEPFFSSTAAFEYEDEVAATGVTPILYYDPPGRVIRVELPNGTLRKVEFDPWSQTTWDENDSINDPHCTADAALTSLAVGEDTPTTVYLDVQGRVYETDEMYAAALGSTPATLYTTTLALDVVGNPTTVTDARGNDTQTQSFDMLGRPMQTVSADAGTTTAFLDVAGQPVQVLKSGDLLLAYAYDALRRRTTLTATEGTGSPRIVEVNEYGESHGTTNNHRGKLYQQWDTAGKVVFVSYDFKGNLLSSTRTYWNLTNGDEVTWTGTASTDDGKLESGTGTSYAITQTYDAMNRLVDRVTPDNSTTSVTYNEAGLLEAVSVKIRGSSTATSFVSNIDYNARGQRTRIEYGNGAVTDYEYDPDTFRLLRLLTVRTSDGVRLQDLRYSYDPVGNIRAIFNYAEDTRYFANGAVTPHQLFDYDPLYRLIQATGREKTSLGYVAPGDEPAFGSRPDAASAVQSYRQNYDYDEVGNILQMAHFVASGSSYNWTRDYAYASGSNRLDSTDVGSIHDVFAYDDRGSIVYLPHLRYSSTQAANIEVDFRDQMKKAYLDSSNDAIYFYDASGQRVRKVVRTGTTQDRKYIGGIFEVWSSDPGTGIDDERETLHVMDDQRRIALVETKTVGTPYSSPASRQRFQLGNHLETAVLELSENASIISYEEYHPYGTTAWQAPALSEVSAKRYRYSGKEKDDETGLYYHGARYYACWLARWTSTDPTGTADGANRYAYVLSNPVCKHDMTGLAGTETEAEALLIKQLQDSGTQYAQQVWGWVTLPDGTKKLGRFDFVAVGKDGVVKILEAKGPDINALTTNQKQYIPVLESAGGGTVEFIGDNAAKLRVGGKSLDGQIIQGVRGKRFQTTSVTEVLEHLGLRTAKTAVAKTVTADESGAAKVRRVEDSVTVSEKTAAELGTKEAERLESRALARRLGKYAPVVGGSVALYSAKVMAEDAEQDFAQGDYVSGGLKKADAVCSVFGVGVPEVDPATMALDLTITYMELPEEDKNAGLTGIANAWSTGMCAY